jgi:dTDP-4-dehydrorhamnose reductase
MLGRTLQRRFGGEITAVDVQECDITDAAAVEALVAAVRPRAVIHAAAMTAVDACENQAELAFRVNAQGTAAVAAACRRHGARLIAISTDYVFAGDLDRPYRETDPPGPRTVYGASKLAGEEAVRRLCPDHLIARTAWLYGPGGPSFVHAMSRLGAQAGPPLPVVDDQLGNPTSTDALAGHLRLLVDHPLTGTAHLSCEGEATWFRFAQAVFAARGFTRALTPCTTAQFPRPAPRPANSRLDKAVLREHDLPPMPRWEEALAAFVQEHPDG